MSAVSFSNNDVTAFVHMQGVCAMNLGKKRQSSAIMTCTSAASVSSVLSSYLKEPGHLFQDS